MRILTKEELNEIPTPASLTWISGIEGVGGKFLIGMVGYKYMLGNDDVYYFELKNDDLIFIEKLYLFSSRKPKIYALIQLDPKVRVF